MLLAQPRADAIRAALVDSEELYVPAHFHVEVLSALRRYSLRGKLTDLQTADALAALDDLRALTYPLRELSRSIWQLGFNLTTYDAAYLALARSLDADLLTLDGALAEAAAGDGRLVTV